MDIEVGRTATRRLEVGEEHTAQRVGSGDVAVLATPTVLAFAEGACVDCVADVLDEGSTSVGTWAEIHHRKPSPVGAEVEWRAELTEVDGRRLSFEVAVTQDDDEVARVSHRRAVVDRDRFAG